LKVLLSKQIETVGLRLDGKGKGCKVTETEVDTYWIMESDATQCCLYKVRETLEHETRSNYEFEGKKCIVLEENFYGKVSHCIHSFIEKKIAKDDLTTDIKVWEKIEGTLRSLADSKDVIKFVEGFKSARKV